jgi:hypothetical protein
MCACLITEEAMKSFESLVGEVWRSIFVKGTAKLNDAQFFGFLELQTLNTYLCLPVFLPARLFQLALYKDNIRCDSSTTLYRAGLL